MRDLILKILSDFNRSCKGDSNSVKIQKLNILIKIHADNNEFLESGVLQKQKINLIKQGGMFVSVLFFLRKLNRGIFKHHEFCLQVGDLFFKSFN